MSLCENHIFNSCFILLQKEKVDSGKTIIIDRGSILENRRGVAGK